MEALGKVLVGDCAEFLNALLSRCSALGVPLSSSSQVDHICFRCATKQEYSDTKSSFSNIARLAGESIINGRPIATFELFEPILFKGSRVDDARVGCIIGWSIPAVELCSPKDVLDARDRQGYDHVEVVLSDRFEDMLECTNLLESFANRHANLVFDKSGMNKAINQDIVVHLGDGFKIKYHARPLLEVCEYERQHGLGVSC